MNSIVVWGCSAILLLAADAAYAQTAREGGGASAQLMQEMQQLASERTQLQAENAKLKKELDDVKKQLNGLETEKAALSSKVQNSAAALSRSSTNAEGLEQSLTQQRVRMEELVAKFRETATSLRDVESDRSQIKDQLTTRDSELKTCVERNLALYQINDEVLDRFENQGFWSSVGKAEPFTQLKRVEIENLVEDYRNRADDQRTDAAVAITPPGG